MPFPAPLHTWIFRCIIAFVLACHAILIHGYTRLQPRPAASPSAFSDTIFSTRTIELAPTPVQTAPVFKPENKPAAAPRKPSAGAVVNSNIPEDSLVAEADTVANNIPITDNLPTEGLSALQNRPHKISDATPVQEPPHQEAATMTAPAPAPKKEVPTTRYAVPASAILKYDIKGEVKGFAYYAKGQLSWQHNGSNYDAALEISHFLLGSRTQTSSGHIGASGLEPLRFADKAHNEAVAQMDHSQKQATFSTDGSRTPLEDGAQDHLSIFLQLSALFSGNPDRYQTGDRLAFQAVGAKSSEHWLFEVGQSETLNLPGGTLQALKLTRQPLTEGAPKVEVWMAPKMQYLPVRIRLTQGDGDFVEQQWRSIQKPE